MEQGRLTLVTGNAAVSVRSSSPPCFRDTFNSLSWADASVTAYRIPWGFVDFTAPSVKRRESASTPWQRGRTIEIGIFQLVPHAIISLHCSPLFTALLSSLLPSALLSPPLSRSAMPPLETNLETFPSDDTRYLLVNGKMLPVLPLCLLNASGRFLRRRMNDCSALPQPGQAAEGPGPMRRSDV